MAHKKNNHAKTYAFFAVLGLVLLYFYTLNKNSMETEQNKKKKQSTMDKVMFGLVIGGAIGSVLGLTVAPEKGKKVRKSIKQKSGKLIGKSKEFFEEHEDAISLVTNKSKGLVSHVTDLLFRKKKHAEHKSAILQWLEDMDEIPTESEEVSQ